MKATPLISLGVSVMLGIGAVLIGRGYMMSRDTNADAQVQPLVAMDMSTIMVARTTIKMGDPVDATMLKEVEWPTDMMPLGVVTDASMLGEGKFARGLIAAGEPISYEKLDETRSMMTLAATITPGMRAVSITVRKDTGVAGFVLPGDRVDVNEFIKKFSTDSITSDVAVSGEFIAKPVLKNVHVLAVDQKFAPGMEGAHVSNTVTLEVSPDDALKLGVASQRGVLGLALISPEDEHPVEMVKVAAPAKRRAVQRRLPAKTVKPKAAKVTVINGAVQTEVSAPASSSSDKKEGAR